MRDSIASTISVASVLLAACTGVPQPAAHGEPDASDADADGDGDVDTGPEPTMTAIPDWRLTWAVRAGGEEYFEDPGDMFREVGASVAPLPDGSVYLAGQVAEAAVFGEGEPNETAFPEEYPGWSDGFLARYSPDGALAWVRRIGGGSDDHAFDVAALDDGTAVVVGRFDSQEIVLGAGEENETLLDGGVTNAFVARYAADGSLISAYRIPMLDAIGNFSYARQVEQLADGALLVAGAFQGTAWPGTEFEVSSFSPSSDTGNWDGLLAWLDVDGSVTRTIRIGSDDIEYFRNVLSLPSGEVLVAALYDGDEVFGIGEPGETTLHCQNQFSCSSLARYDVDGRLEWVRDLNIFNTGGMLSIELLASGDVGLAARFASPSDPDGDGIFFDLGDSHDMYGAVLAAYDAETGEPLWVRLGSNEADNGYGLGVGVFAVPEGGFIAGLAFENELSFEGTDEGQTSLVSAGSIDTALLYLSATGSFRWMHRIGNEGWDLPSTGAQLDGTTMWFTGAYGSDPFIATSGNGDDVALPLSGYTDVFLMRFDSTAVPAD